MEEWEANLIPSDITVPHNKYKLNHYGIKANTLKWIGNVLKHRRQ